MSDPLAHRLQIFNAHGHDITFDVLDECEAEETSDPLTLLIQGEERYQLEHNAQPSFKTLCNFLNI